MEAILQEYFDQSNCNITPLEGYISTNYRVTSKGHNFVLKKYPYTVATFALLQAENRLLGQLGALKTYDFSQNVLSTNKEALLIAEGHIYRLLTFVEGDFLGEVPHTPALLSSFGMFLAQMDNVIFETHDPSIAAKEFQWDLQHFPKNRTFLKYIPNAGDRSLVDYFFLQFEEQLAPYRYHLRKGIIHNDANDWNVLTQNGKVSGIIDFGDMCHSWLINEVAVAITYVMMEKEHPLAVAQEVIKGYHGVLPLLEPELDLLYYLVAARLCTSVCNSAHTKTLKPDSDYITISEKPAWKLLKKWIGINPIKAKDAFRAAAGFAPTTKKPIGDQLMKRKLFLSEALSLSYQKPIAMDRSAFQYMYDQQGNTFLDAYNNIMLAGHCHPKVVRAGQHAMARLNTNTRYLYDILLDYSESLLSKFPPNLNKVFFVNSGSAATDLAIRLAQVHTQKEQIMVLEHGYHGNTRVGIDVSHYKYSHKGGPGKKDYILQTPLPKVYNSGYADDGTAGTHFAEVAISQIHDHEDKIAAFIAEPIVGCGGQVPLAQGYLQKVYPQIRKQGGICISDEVQVGFGRLGDCFWGFEMHGVDPDMVILGKPMGNGHPIGAVVTTSEIAKSFENGPEFFSSFGGNPVSCAIGLAVLEVIMEEELQAHAKSTGDYLKTRWQQLREQYPRIADVRGSGLFLGIELVDAHGNPDTRLAAYFKNGLRERHILIGTDGPFDSVLKIKPPLSFKASDCDILMQNVVELLQIFMKNE
ncbi:MAG: aminotransferase class III-fold pyridoxal phosphate-dependent enzyme [Flavobacteriaceae bacterium]